MKAQPLVDVPVTKHSGLNHLHMRHIIQFTLIVLAGSNITLANGRLVEALLSTPHLVTLAGGGIASRNDYHLIIQREGEVVTYRLENRGDQPLRIDEVTLHAWDHGLPGHSVFYGEGYTMLSQTGGTLGEMADLGEYTDRKHYRLPEPRGFRTVYGVMTLTPPDNECLLAGFGSCRRFIGKFHVNEQRIRIAIDCEQQTLRPGETWELEEVYVIQGPDRNVLLDGLANRLSKNHPRPLPPRLPTGWCSWYCFGPNVTADNVTENLSTIRQQAPELRYIQIDDGYQPWMGDWLETGKAFGGNVQDVLQSIRQHGYEPAIWVAPFVASPQSELFRTHPEWFVMDEHGKPLRSDDFTFGGWRLGPWYMLDGTHPDAQRYLEDVFRTMREEWGCTYFKLDANTWGAMPQGVRHDPQATSVEAYRRGMAAVRRGAGPGFLLGCNHAIWPSIGEVHGSRSSRDIRRQWGAFAGAARENLMRNWQNQRLWWNDPDCLLLSGDPAANEKQFHAVATYASGGMLLSGDDLTRLPQNQFATLRRCATSTGTAARFASERLELGTIDDGNARYLVLLNWSNEPTRHAAQLEEPCRIVDVFTDEDLGTHDREFVLPTLAPRSGRLLELRSLR